ncbi:MAG: hypothetical protein CL678_00655 [Bdellovibrionaceae bacterium]|nr:hypothetical protein [Pseudobdellovibrionaceae bacterium]
MSRFASPTATLAAILDPDQHEDLRQWLITLDVKDSTFALEAWTALWHSKDQPTSNAFEFAYNARLSHVFSLPRRTEYQVGLLPINRLVSEFADRTSFASHGDEYIAAALKIRLPGSTTCLQPRKNPAYAVAAAVLKDDANEIVRPLIEQPLKEIVKSVAWNSDNVTGFFASVITMREMARFPELYVGSDIAAADPDVPALAVLQLESQHKLCVIGNGELTIVRSIVDALCMVLQMAQSSDDGAATIMKVLRKEDTTSALAHAFAESTAIE